MRKHIKLGNDLPEHLIFAEILSRLSIKSIVRLKLVCRHWNLAVSSSGFGKIHLQRVLDSTAPNVLTLLSGKSVQLLSLIPQGERQYNGELMKASDYFRLLPSENIKIPNIVVSTLSTLHPSRALFALVGSCNGLICASAAVKRQYMFSIWNPATRQQRLFKGPKIKGSTPLSGFGYDSSSDDYKVVVLGGSSASPVTAHLFSLRTNEWKILNVDWETLNLRWLSKDNLDKCGNWPLFYIKGFIPMAIDVGETLHWPLGDCYPEENTILAFDLAKETFFTIPLPNAGHDQVSRRYSLCKVRNKLGVCWMWPSHGEGNVLEVLTMEVHRVSQSWKTVFRVTHLDQFNLNNGYPTMFEFRDERPGFLILNIRTFRGFICIQQHNGDDHHVPIQGPLPTLGFPDASLSYPITYTQSLISPFHTPAR